MKARNASVLVRPLFLVFGRLCCVVGKNGVAFPSRSLRQNAVQCTLTAVQNDQHAKLSLPGRAAVSKTSLEPRFTDSVNTISASLMPASEGIPTGSSVRDQRTLELPSGIRSETRKSTPADGLPGRIPKPT